MLSILIGDSYPKTYGCGAKFTCNYLKRQGKCNSKWKSAGLPGWCLNKLTAWEKDKKVKTFHCRRTCGNCRPGKQKIVSNHRKPLKDFGKKSSRKKDITENMKILFSLN